MSSFAVGDPIKVCLVRSAWFKDLCPRHSPAGATSTFFCVAFLVWQEGSFLLDQKVLALCILVASGLITVDRVTVCSRELGQTELLPLYVFSLFMMSHTEEKASLSQLRNSDKQLWRGLRQDNWTFWNIRESEIELKSYVPPTKLQVGTTVRVQFWGWKERNSTSEALKNASSMWLKDVHHMDLNGSAFREQWHQRIILNFWSPMSPGSGRGSKRPEINFPAFIMLASVFILVLIPRSSFSKDPLKKITSNTQMTLFIYMND